MVKSPMAPEAAQNLPEEEQTEFIYEYLTVEDTPEQVEEAWRRTQAALSQVRTRQSQARCSGFMPADTISGGSNSSSFFFREYG